MATATHLQTSGRPDASGVPRWMRGPLGSTDLGAGGLGPIWSAVRLVVVKTSATSAAAGAIGLRAAVGVIGFPFGGDNVATVDDGRAGLLSTAAGMSLDG